MEYKIIGSVMPVVELTLRLGDRIFAQPGAMMWMDGDIVMETSAGGLLGGLKRSLMGESFFQSWFYPRVDGAKIAFGHSYPGHIIPVEADRGIVCQKRAFLCAQEGVQLELAFQRKLGAGFFGGEGFIMQKLQGRGMAFLEIDGECVVRELAPGEILKVDTGSVAAYEQSVQMDIEAVRGFKNIFFGGEGLFLTTLRGPGKVWLQTMPLPNLARSIFPYLPIPRQE
ncbi:MAG TPA: TIGR00266 family protein [Bacillota bacterium]|nr:TIGR00266 family protein [Bacillota bacterium]HQE01369.1 TIGR00266 family protein [Bacillota bacterium]